MEGHNEGVCPEYNGISRAVPSEEQFRSRFAADKKMLGWGIAQRRDDRIDSALFCTGLWHNLFNFDR